MEQGHRDNSLPARIREGLPRLLPEYLIQQRWFGGKARTIESAAVLDLLPIPVDQHTAFLILAQVKYAEGEDDLYALPLIPATGEGARIPQGEGAASTLHLKPGPGSRELNLNNAFLNQRFNRALLDLIRNGSSIRGSEGELFASPFQAFHNLQDAGREPLEPSLMKAEQSNTSVRYGDRFILKFFRRLEEGVHPDLEIGTFLTEKASFKHAPPLCGALEYRRRNSPPIVLGILQAFVPNQGDAWRYTLDALEKFFQKISPSRRGTEHSAGPALSFMELCQAEFPPDAPELMGDYWDSSALLGRRTAQLHLALASGAGDPDFCPEEFSSSLRRSQGESMRDLTMKVLRDLEKRLADLPAQIQRGATHVLMREGEISGRFEAFTQMKMTGQLIRIHGDYHLGQLIHTGSDFVIIDFEGEPARPLMERRKKHCPVQDVAGMLRSFHYAACTALSRSALSPECAPGAREYLEPWAQTWQRWASARFLNEYRSTAGTCKFLPQSENEFAVLLDAYLLEKAVYELGYELNNRPDWVWLPLQGILQQLGPRA